MGPELRNSKQYPSSVQWLTSFNDAIGGFFVVLNDSVGYGL